MCNHDAPPLAAERSEGRKDKVSMVTVTGRAGEGGSVDAVGLLSVDCRRVRHPRADTSV